MQSKKMMGLFVSTYFLQISLQNCSYAVETTSINAPLIAIEEGKSNFSPLSNTLKGLRNNSEIVDAAYRLVKDRPTSLQRLQAFL